MKLVLALASIFLVISLVDSKPGQAGLFAATSEHNLYECDASRANVKVYEKTIQRPGRSGRYLQSSVQFPLIGSISRPITCIIVQDLHRGGLGGYADITGGGLNSRYVSISLESQYGEDLRFSVEIYTDNPGRAVPNEAVVDENQS